MKIKISPFIYSIIFLIIFFVLYKGLQNSNIYTPNLKIEKNIPSFKTKIFDNDNFENLYSHIARKKICSAAFYKFLFDNRNCNNILDKVDDLLNLESQFKFENMYL